MLIFILRIRPLAGSLILLLGLSSSVIGQTSSVRIATFNAALNRCLDGRSNPCLDGGLSQVLSDGDFRPARQIAEILQRVRPDVVLLNEFNFDSNETSADLFQQNYLSVSQNNSRLAIGGEPIEYPYRYLAESNTGIHSGFDLNNDGQIDNSPGDGAYANDAFGFGEFAGRYGMMVLSRFPIELDQVRTFQEFLWKDMPDALLPDDLNTNAENDWYSDEELSVMRLSSKSHWDIPIAIGDQTIHLLASHPTPPVFDGPEDRNGRRNHDEIRLWADYISGDSANYLIDDLGRTGGLEEDASFIIAGDLNADPARGDSIRQTMDQLLAHPKINSQITPVDSTGSDITSSFGLRVDYVLPSNDLTVFESGIFFPDLRDPLRRLATASDHRLVWIDVVVPEPSGCLLPIIGFLAFVGCQRKRR